jgi:hypothetical protein
MSFYSPGELPGFSSAHLKNARNRYIHLGEVLDGDSRYIYVSLTLMHAGTVDSCVGLGRDLNNLILKQTQTEVKQK